MNQTVMEKGLKFELCILGEVLESPQRSHGAIEKRSSWPCERSSKTFKNLFRFKEQWIHAEHNKAVTETVRYRSSMNNTTTNQFKQFIC